MINIVWFVLLILGILYSFFTGNIEIINNEIFTSGKKALDIILEILPLMVIWMGLMQIATDSGLLKKIAHKISKPLRVLFPEIPKDHEAFGYIASNIAVNILGLGSAATPFGLKAMESMQKLNKKKDTASNSMITFLVLNTSGMTLIPTTIISLRMLHHSKDPYIIIPTVIISTIIATVGGLIFDYFCRRKSK